MPELRTRDTAKWQENVSLYATRKKLRGYYELHWHEYFEIELVISGHGHCILNGQPYDLNPGDIYLLSTTDFHEIHSENVEVLHVSFDQSQIDSELTDKIISCEKNMFFSLNRKEYLRFYSLLSQLVDECSADEEYRQPYISNLLHCLFIMFIRKAELKNTDSGDAYKNHIATAIMYLELHFRENPTLETVAAHVNLNKNYFCSLFRKETGKTMVQFINDLKLSYSKNLLKSTNLSITEICYNCGYNSFSNYIHKFKQKYGETPLQVRKKVSSTA